MSVAREVPALQSYAYTEGIPGRLIGPYDRAFAPVMLPLEAIAPLAERLAEIAVERDRDGERRRKGEEIERYLIARVSDDIGGDPAWNSSAAWTIENVVSRVIFKHYYRGGFGDPSDGLFNSVNELGVEVGRLFRIVLAESKPRAFDRLLEKLGEEVEEERLRAERGSTD